MQNSRVVGLALAGWLGGTALAMAAGADQFGKNGIIVDTAYVEAALKRDAIVLDVRAPAAYERGHIPGAVSLDIGTTRDSKTEDYIPLDQVAKILGDAGLDPNKETIVYATRGSAGAYFGQVTLELFGNKKVHVYHGGIDDWTAGGKPIATQPTKLAAVSLKASPLPGITLTSAEVMDRLGKPTVQILDARTVAEHKGEDLRPGATRGGNIPGSINIPYEMNLVEDKAGQSLKSLDALKLLYAKLDPTKETVVYCQSGVRASETAAILRDLGFTNVKVYDSSWIGYSAIPTAPVNK